MRASPARAAMEATKERSGPQPEERQGAEPADATRVARNARASTERKRWHVARPAEWLPVSKVCSSGAEVGRRRRAAAPHGRGAQTSEP